MKRLLPLVVLTLLAATTICIAQTGAPSKPKSETTGGNSLDEMIISRSKQVWEAYKNRDTAAMKALTADEYVAHTQAGPSNLKQDVDTIQKLTIEAFSIDQPKTKVLAGKLRDLGMSDVLILTDKLDDNLFLSARNLPNVLILEARHADPVSLMRFEKVLVTKAAVKHLEEALA